MILSLPARNHLGMKNALTCSRVVSLVENTIKSVLDEEVEMETYDWSVIAALAAFFFSGVITYLDLRKEKANEDRTRIQEGRPAVESVIRTFAYDQPIVGPPMPLG
jgi:hypothetical protein